MRIIIIITLAFISTRSFGQVPNIVGTYSSMVAKIDVTFNQDSTFQYATKGVHPTFYTREDFFEKGHWSISGDTIILNPQLAKKVFVESDFKEEEIPGHTNLFLTCNHIKRYFDPNGNILGTDTLQIERLDYSFNELKKNNRVRIAQRKSSRCTFAGYIPKEIITTNRTNFVQRPPGITRGIFIGCYEFQGTKEFIIKNPNSNHFTLNVYSNYYQDGQIRHVKFLIRNENVLYTRQKKNGEFEKDNFWAKTDAKLKRQKSSSLGN